MSMLALGRCIQAQIEAIAIGKEPDDQVIVKCCRPAGRKDPARNHQRATMRPAAAPTTARSVMASVYQVATKSGESSAQWAA